MPLLDSGGTMHDGSNRTVGVCDSCGKEKWVFEFEEYIDQYICSGCYYEMEEGRS